MQLVAWTVVLCACASGVVLGETNVAPTPLVYETYSDAGRYLFVPVPQNWTDASKVCRTYNGHLAFPKTQDEADVLWSIMTRYNINQTHAGFHDQFIEGQYFTAKGRLMNETSFKQWSSGAPIGGSSNNCGGLRGDGLVDVDCTDKYPSICEENEPPGGEGFKDYVYIQGHGYFKYITMNNTWEYAMMFCYDEGSHLWIINSEEERTAVFEAFSINQPYYGVWVGVHHRHADRYFVTIFDDTLESTGYSKWRNGEPMGTNKYYPYVCVTNANLRIQGPPQTLNFMCEYNPVN